MFDARTSPLPIYVREEKYKRTDSTDGGLRQGLVRLHCAHGTRADSPT